MNDIRPTIKDVEAGQKRISGSIKRTGILALRMVFAAVEEIQWRTLVWFWKLIDDMLWPMDTC